MGSCVQLTLPWGLEPVMATRSPTRDDRVAAGYGARRLLAVILRQAIYDEAMAAADMSFDRRTWPWDGEWTPQEELHAFWQSDWCANICQWLDITHAEVLNLVQEVRDGTKVIPTDKRRAIARG